MTEPSIPRLGRRGLTDLTRDELLKLVESQQAGIRIQFPGRDAARQLARRVRPRVSRTISKYSVGDPEGQASNTVIEGDNLQAMTSLYRYRGQVDLILTDPPYNTGNDWRYNDRWDTDPNDPALGDWVGPDDAGRHTKWMKFMYPRLQLMRAMLKPTGVLAICIDHRELFRLGEMLDEVYGEANRLAIINWQKSYSPRADKQHVSTATEYVLVYAKDAAYAKTGLLPRTDLMNARYKSPDGDPRLWKGGDLSGPGARTHQRMVYGIQSPFTGELHYPPIGSCWRPGQREVLQWLNDWGCEFHLVDLKDADERASVIGLPEQYIPKVRGLVLKTPLHDAQEIARERLAAGAWPKIFFGMKGDGRPQQKNYLEDVKQGKVPVTYWAGDDYDEPLALGSTSWPHTESGHSQTGIDELDAIVGEGHGFDTVKPLKLFQKIVQLWCPTDGLVVDPFAGSGTTGHAVLALNQVAETTRRFILVEQGRPDRGDSYARTLMADRLKRVIAGDWANGKGTPLRGGFRFVQLQKKVDADTVLRMERDEMLDTVIASHYDTNRRRGGLVSLSDQAYRYLIAKNADDEGFFLVWDGPDENTDLTEEVYEAVAEEAQKAQLGRTYHVYARLYVFQTENVRFYQIPDRILADFGLNLSSEPLNEDFT